jgi:hypothetical protein
MVSENQDQFDPGLPSAALCFLSRRWRLSSMSGMPSEPTLGTSADLGAIQQLMVPSYATVSVQSHVPTRLEMKASNYSRWASFFKSMCAKFLLRHHIDGSAPPRPQDLIWDQADCCVRSWIFGSVDDSILSLAVDGDNQTARNLWVAIEGLFRANKAPRAILHLHDFHSMTQGDSSIDEYAEIMKRKAADLRDVGHPVEDSQLILNLLRSVNPRFSNTANDIANSTVLPDFAAALDLLKLKELRLANEVKTAAAAPLLLPIRHRQAAEVMAKAAADTATAARRAAAMASNSVPLLTSSRAASHRAPGSASPHMARRREAQADRAGGVLLAQESWASLPNLRRIPLSPRSRCRPPRRTRINPASSPP